MRRAVLALAFVVTLAAPVARGQEAPETPSSRRVRVVRPPEGSLRRGAFAVPSWLVCAGGAAVLGAAGGALAWRIKKRLG